MISVYITKESFLVKMVLTLLSKNILAKQISEPVLFLIIVQQWHVLNVSRINVLSQFYLPV